MISRVPAMTATRPIFRFHLHIIQYSQRVQPVTTFLLKLNEQKKLELEEHKKCESIHFHWLNNNVLEVYFTRWNATFIWHGHCRSQTTLQPVSSIFFQRCWRCWNDNWDLSSSEDSQLILGNRGNCRIAQVLHVLQVLLEHTQMKIVYHLKKTLGQFTPSWLK